MSQVFDRASIIGWTIGLSLTLGVMFGGAALGWSSQTIGGAFMLAVIVTIVVSDPLERRYRKRHGVDPERRA